MNLFARLIDEASDADIAVSAVLLRAKVLASNLPGRKLRSWVASELEGYGGGQQDLPPYRIIRTVLLGHFIGPFREAKNVTLPTKHIEADLIDAFENQYFGDPISKI